MKQVINALAPSNWVFTNPELLRETFASDGENLVRGMQLLAEDIKRGGGDLQIRQTDLSKFEVGRNLAITPGKVVCQNELFQLIQYEATTDQVFKRRPAAWLRCRRRDRKLRQPRPPAAPSMM